MAGEFDERRAVGSMDGELPGLVGVKLRVGAGGSSGIHAPGSSPTGWCMRRSTFRRGNGWGGLAAVMRSSARLWSDWRLSAVRDGRAPAGAGSRAATGPAGTGKTLTVAAIARAWQQNSKVIGVANSPSRGRRADQGRITDLLNSTRFRAKIKVGSVRLDPRTLVIIDEGRPRACGTCKADPRPGREVQRKSGDRRRPRAISVWSIAHLQAARAAEGLTR